MESINQMMNSSNSKKDDLLYHTNNCLFVSDLAEL